MELLHVRVERKKNSHKQIKTNEATAIKSDTFQNLLI
jgi:hypothetical protein